MNKLIIEGVQVNLDQLASENENIEQLKSREIFAEGPKQESSYAALWDAVNEVKGKSPDLTLKIEKPKKKSKN